MKNLLFPILISLLVSSFLHAQAIQQAPIFQENSPYGNTPYGKYFYVEPLSGQIDGVLLLMPGFSEYPNSIFTESKLPYVACVNNILTIAVSGDMTLFVQERLKVKFTALIDKVLEQFPETTEKPWVMGGFSAGGTISLRWVEYCQENENCKANFVGVFGVDAPVDLIEIWRYFEREIERNFSEVGMNEAKFVSARFKEQAGTPDEQPEVYAELTPFNIKAKIGEGNEKYLKDIAVRLYHDVDVEWLLKERKRSVYDSNFLQASEMISRLIFLGNDQAEFIQRSGTGFRSNGRRHPHSWSIVDEVECVQWMKGLFEKF